MRGGKTTHDPPYPEATKKKVVIEVPAEEDPVVPQEKGKTTPMNSMIRRCCHF